MEKIVLQQVLTDCDEQAMYQFINSVKKTSKQIREFNLKLTEFQEQLKKLAKDLWTSATRYNILDK